MAEWEVATPGPELVRSLAECHIECWREAYRDLVPAHLLDAFDLDRRAAVWERRRAANLDRLKVAVVDGTVIGFAVSGPSQDDSPVAEHQLNAMYVRAAWYGTGVAHDLMRAVLPEHADVSLWVFEENPRARAFYTKYGFELDGGRRVEAFTPAIEVRMVRRLSGRR
ncbi:GNAT family N-acetyltransferase [Nocardia yamanashiensis]|uniref:GNAT family N-acetyltransferase n=1 Tax=Nocardia yamanashiensis TaxID=209247 RepID=UPI001E2A3C39|nr:GNAT family N-acetyltransferase [Nocardia yamanashiensis]UGT42046.1 GNAT family N-acetyltransferase [Nocardia yamanashiensis]